MSVSLKRQRGGLRRVVVAHVKYRSLDEINDATGALAVTTTPMPPVMFKRCIAAPSLIAYIACRSFASKTSLMHEGEPLDGGLMSRWLEELGGTWVALWSKPCGLMHSRRRSDKLFQFSAELGTFLRNVSVGSSPTG